MILQNKSPYKIRAKLSFWWRIGDSNSWPPACKAGALANWANSPSDKLLTKYIIKTYEKSIYFVKNIDFFVNSNEKRW